MRIARVDRIAAAAACALALAVQATEIGTLFHTPEERAHLDRLRRGEPVGQAASPGPARRGELTGFVKRSDGRGTVWIDGVARAVPPGTAPLLEPRSVRDYADRKDEDLRIERRPTR